MWDSGNSCFLLSQLKDVLRSGNGRVREGKNVVD